MKYEFSDLCLDTGRRQLSRGDEQLKLTKLSFKLLEALVAAAPDMVTHDQLVEKVWGPERIISPENISQRVAMVRQSLGDSPDDPTYIETVYGQGFRLLPDVVVSSAAAVEPQQSTANGRHLIAWMVGAVLIGALVWVMRGMVVQPTVQHVDTESSAPITIAVLPFVNMSNDPQQESFVDGLTEEILNSLVKVDRLLVTGRTSSFVYRDQAQDLREVGAELNVDYLLEGSVRKNGDQIRVTAQLIDVATGAHLSSNTYDRNLTDIFAVQNEISRQVAAELKISLIHKDDQYTRAFARLDAIAIEQLFTARAKIAEYAGAPIKEALDMLDALNQRFPHTPEIMGLIARGHMIYGSTGSLPKDEPALDYVTLSNDTLQLDPSNLDALLTLAVTYDDFPAHRIDAIQYYQKMIRFHRGRKETYSLVLDYLPLVSTPCEEILAAVHSVPEGVLSDEDRHWYVEHYGACVESPWETEWGDDWYSGSLEQVEENPNQRHLSILYMMQLRAGAFDAARQTELHIDFVEGGWWVSSAAVKMYMYNQGSIKPLMEHIRFFVAVNYGSYDRSGLLLVHHGLTTGEFQYVGDYLERLEEFPIRVGNEHSSIALMVLQYHNGEIEKSQQTARTFLESANEYLASHPGSYRYYNLAKLHLIAAFYAGEFEEAKHVLATGFGEDHPFWTDDYAAVRTALHPWLDRPVAIAYMARIQADRQRVREKFGVD
ncbi:MAG: FlgO family outer membrane protein [Woeseiaceae bacterium]